MSNKLNFLTALAAVTLVSAIPQKEAKEKEDSTSKRVEKNPTNGADFRILSNGKVYPSAAFVAEFGLEYLSKSSATKSMGLDFFDSTQWSQLQGAPQMLLGYVVDQDKPKVELFAGTRYNAEGNPINSVLEQGTILSDDTLEMIATTLGYIADHKVIDAQDVAYSAWDNMLNGRRFVDFYMMREAPSLVIPDGIYQIPKVVARGEKKGDVTTVKREHIKVLPIVEYNDEVANELREMNTGNTASSEDNFEYMAPVETDESAELEEVVASSVDVENETSEQLYARLNQSI